MGDRWSKKEDRALLDGTGVFALAWFQRKTQKRSPDAIYARSRRLFGPGGLTRGTYTLAQAAETTGYNRKQLQRAQSALGQKWKRLSPRGAFLITQEQLDELTTWLTHDYWCAKLRLYGCCNCGSSKSPNRGMGLCARCYFRLRKLLTTNGLPSSGRRLLKLIKSWSPPPQMSHPVYRAQAALEKGKSPIETEIRAVIEWKSKL